MNTEVESFSFINAKFETLFSLIWFVLHSLSAQVERNDMDFEDCHPLSGSFSELNALHDSDGDSVCDITPGPFLAFQFLLKA